MHVSVFVKYCVWWHKTFRLRPLDSKFGQTNPALFIHFNPELMIIQPMTDALTHNDVTALNVWMSLSTRSFVEGWCWQKCLTSFALVKSSAINCAPLSVTTCTGSLYIECKWQNAVIVSAATVDDISTTLSHFECALTASSNSPRNGPAKSKGTFYHGWHGTDAGLCLLERHER